MLTNPDLAALSEAATTADEGVWSVADLVRQQLTKARWSFLMALEAAYRSGDLVLIDHEGMRERTGRALESVSHINDRDVWADAAIAAILGDG